MSQLKNPTIWNSLLGASVSYVNAGGLRTRIIEAGSGPALFLLHGTGGHAEAFSHNILPLSATYRVIAPDMVGHGLSDKPDIPYIISDYTDHVLAIMDALGIEAANIGGVSLGGWVASFVALSAPKRVSTVINCTGGVFRWPDGQYPEEAADRVRMASVNRDVSDTVTHATVRRRLELLFHQTEKLTDELVELRYELYSHPRMQEILHTIHHMFPYESEDRIRFSLTEERLRSIVPPTLYLWTDHNPGSGLRSAERAASLTPTSELYVMNNCGHWPQWEEPDEFNRTVDAFVRRHTEPSSALPGSASRGDGP